MLLIYEIFLMHCLDIFQVKVQILSNLNISANVSSLNLIVMLEGVYCGDYRQLLLVTPCTEVCICHHGKWRVSFVIVASLHAARFKSASQGKTKCCTQSRFAECHGCNRSLDYKCRSKQVHK